MWVCHLCDSLRLPELLLPGDRHFLDQFLRLLQPLLQLGRLHRLRETAAVLHRPPHKPPRRPAARAGSRHSNLGLRQLLLQFLHFLPELSDDPGVGVFVDDGVVDDALGPVGVTQGGQRLVVVVRRGADGGDHGGAAVPPEAVLRREKHSVYLRLGPKQLMNIYFFV